MNRIEFIYAAVGCVAAFRIERAVTHGGVPETSYIPAAADAAGQAYDALETHLRQDKDGIQTRDAAIAILKANGFVEEPDVDLPIPFTPTPAPPKRRGRPAKPKTEGT